MNAFDIANLFYALSGLLVGLLVGMTGVGGGSLMTPLLILLFGVHPATAVGVDLLYASITKSAGTAVHGLARTVDWRVVGRLSLGSLPMSALTLFVLSRLGPTTPATDALVTTVLSLALFFTALSLVFRNRILEIFSRHVGEIPARRIMWLTVATGGALGALVSISSVGAGALGVTALIVLYPKLPMVRIVGSDIAHAVPLTLAAGIGHWALGSIDFALLGALLVGSVPGIVIGSYAAARFPEPVLRLLLAAVLFIVAGRLFMA